MLADRGNGLWSGAKTKQNKVLSHFRILNVYYSFVLFWYAIRIHVQSIFGIFCKIFLTYVDELPKSIYNKARTWLCQVTFNTRSSLLVSRRKGGHLTYTLSLMEGWVVTRTVKKNYILYIYLMHVPNKQDALFDFRDLHCIRWNYQLHRRFR